MKSVTDLSFFFFCFEQTVYHLLDNIPRERQFSFSRTLLNMHSGDWDYVHACHTCTLGMYLLSEQIENTFLTFPVWRHVAVEQHRRFSPCLAASLKSL